ncbi:MAG: ABC transporter substrate-binding protein [Betaproteobacteria bacterium]|nr:ABC transporter substrate-binding protein [Betaproteobacteria bacterium]
MKFSSPAFVRSTLGVIALTLSASVMAQSVVRFQDYPGTGNLMVRVAQEQGFCQQAGIRCELRTIPAAPLGMQTMLSGDIEVYFGPTEVAVAAVARKAPITIIGAGFTDPVFFIAIGAKTELETEKEGYPGVVKSFKGKKIGVTQRGSGAEFQVIDMLADVGLTANDVTFVAVGAPDTAFPALTRGQVDLIMTFPPTDGMCEVLKACRVVVDPRKGQGPKSLLATRGGSGSMAVKTEWAAANPQTVAAIRRTLDLSEAFIANPANFGRTLEILRKTFALQLPNAEQIAEVALRNSISNFKARGNVPAIQAVANAMTENKLLPGRVEMAPAVLP